MGLIFFVGLIVLLAGMPKIFRSTSDQFPVNDPVVHASWKKTTLRSHYAFLGAIAAFGIAITVITSVVDVRDASSYQLNPIMSAVFFVGILGPIPVLIWAVVLNRKAMKLKDIIQPPLSASEYYERFYPPSAPPASPPSTSDTNDQNLSAQPPEQ